MIDSVNTFSGHSSSMAPVCGVSGGEREMGMACGHYMHGGAHVW